MMESEFVYLISNTFDSGILAEIISGLVDEGLGERSGGIDKGAASGFIDERLGNGSSGIDRGASSSIQPIEVDDSILGVLLPKLSLFDVPGFGPKFGQKGNSSPYSAYKLSGPVRMFSLTDILLILRPFGAEFPYGELSAYVESELRSNAGRDVVEEEEGSVFVSDEDLEGALGPVVEDGRVGENANENAITDSLSQPICTEDDVGFRDPAIESRKEVDKTRIMKGASTCAESSPSCTEHCGEMLLELYRLKQESIREKVRLVRETENFDEDSQLKSLVDECEKTRRELEALLQKLNVASR